MLMYFFHFNVTMQLMGLTVECCARLASAAVAAAVASWQQMGVSDSNFSAARPCRSGFAMQSVPLCNHVRH